MTQRLGRCVDKCVLILCQKARSIASLCSCHCCLAMFSARACVLDAFDAAEKSCRALRHSRMRMSEDHATLQCGHCGAVAGHSRGQAIITHCHSMHEHTWASAWPLLDRSLGVQPADGAAGAKKMIFLSCLRNALASPLRVWLRCWRRVGVRQTRSMRVRHISSRR